ncbi:MAG TPA: hypothetical protein VI981_02170 [Candidatus Paceibacterota bacterium]|uniref:Uncharacterized protein n=1 Tax=Candidatus Sungbacteria bacterium RIFCSPHIGHO2_01_FULL_47_32 TaxID=1802264 RepID=A0A1G2K838_9BACT|nr:MAG: hypothetical protein UX72_C0051G0007 [Parcubacteria group bacterium GW2011_GWA2_47_10]OGZ95373.1 MAG: hypothetical protein A2633_04290 [Candidatus Sungbacteria bacterium RIFCSPHIGHO2_01_FULL_47_32]OGZ98870.1 MAG: hypothetical protein A3D57_03945 [Candidatus Sungbacteria bacterium RIFCSPHIGHO2_02_FULL_46_12]OHA05231.1 MAG: hypothetical protein A3A28_04160 [Candidatus Sungbacteria bacterium RIFCSPLOWO2_01_FULL_47_32]
MPEAMPMPQKGVNPEKLKKLEEAKKALEGFKREGWPAEVVEEEEAGVKALEDDIKKEQK